ncbi:MAG: hypothetical protein HQM06_14825, partial [Magnetococcales bacterium]|nr:hypothetical protein [Magnetococcales bacterium]
MATTEQSSSTEFAAVLGSYSAVASTMEDSSVALDLNFLIADSGSSDLTAGEVVLTGVPAGVTFNKGVAGPDNTWIIAAADLQVTDSNGDGVPEGWTVPGLQMNLAPDSGDNLQLGVQLSVTGAAGTQMIAMKPIAVQVTPQADAASISTTADGQGVQLALSDLDGSEFIDGNLVLTGLPSGATLNIGQAGSDANTWLISQSDLQVTSSNADGQPIAWALPNLQVTLPGGGSGTVAVGVQVTTGDGFDTQTSSGQVQLAVAPALGSTTGSYNPTGASVGARYAEAAAPITITFNADQGTEGSAIPLDLRIALTDTDGSESLTGSILLSGLPEGATLSVGTAGANGTWTLALSDLTVTATNASGKAIAWAVPGLTVTPAEDSGSNFQLSVQVANKDVVYMRSTTCGVIVREEGQVDGVAIQINATPDTQQGTVALDLYLSQLDQDGSEFIDGHLLLTGIPDGVQLNKGMAGPDHTWIIAHSDLQVVESNSAGDPVAWTVPDLQATSVNYEGGQLVLGVQVTVGDGFASQASSGQLILQMPQAVTEPPVTVPPETTPPETVPPETAPPETVPPETAPPETAPPETAPPE